MQDQTASLDDHLTTSTFHSFLLALTGCVPPTEGSQPDFWRNELPERAIAALVDRDPPFQPFDKLIIDEAQDLLGQQYLDILDLIVRGGLRSGRWQLFGDFEKQAIYSVGDANPREILNERVGMVHAYSLRVNCRNSPRIAALVHLLGGLTPNYSRVLRADNGIEPEVRYFTTLAEQQALFIETLEGWYGDGIAGNEITILSPRSDRACLAASILKDPWRGRVRPRSEAYGGHIAYSSIHAFKGLESSAIIVTDIEQLSGEIPLDLFYIAVTRALHRLTILVHEPARDEVFRALTGLRAVQESQSSGVKID